MTTSPTPLRILIVEHNPVDAEAMLQELRRAGFAPESTRVETEEEYLAHLDHKLDVILSDFRLPRFVGLRALELLRAREMDIPFVIVSSSRGSRVAVDAMRNGASDYLTKGRMAQLGAAVSQALDQKRAREEKRNSETALRQSEEHYRVLFESNPNPIYVFHTDTLAFLAVNEAARVNYGYTREEFLGMTMRDISLPEDVPVLVSTLSQHIKKHQGVWVHRKKDGTLINVDITALPAAIDGAKTMLAVAIDITERKQAVDELRASEDRFRVTFEQAAVGIAHVSPDGTWLRVNQKLCEIFARTHEDLINHQFADILHPDDIEGSRALGLKFLAGEIQTFSLEQRYLRGGGAWLWARNTISLVRKPSGEPKYFITVIEDISERKYSEQRIQEQARLLDLAHDAIIVRDMEDRIVFWNKGAERLYGWSRAEIWGRSIVDAIYRDDRVFQVAKGELMTRGEWNGEMSHFSKSGVELVVNSRWTLLPNDNGEPGSVLEIHSDITEKKKFEVQFLRSQRLESIGTLASGVAHDLNNILAPILMSAQLLQDGVEPGMQKTLFASIEASAQRGADIVKQVLTFARGVEGERMLLEPGHLLKEIAKIAGETFPKTIAISDQSNGSLWAIKGDATQLHQVLLNLCVNARDAMPDGGSLTLSAENVDVDAHFASMMPDSKAGHYVQIKVSDTGRGIPQHIIGKIFDPFFTTKELGKGTGLGLSTTLGIVKSHGGCLNVYSEPGKGTTFKVFLPAATESAAAIVRTEERKPGPRGNGELVLVVDDEVNIRTVTETLLTKHGYKVVLAADGIEAVAIYAKRSREIAVVLTDIMMPHLDGIALIRALRIMNPEAKVIASTGQEQSGRITELHALDVVTGLAKPYTSDILLKMLRDLILS